jgi:hypothetical protein
VAASGVRRYFFDMRIGDDLGEDDGGADLENLEAVQKEALRVLADVARELSRFLFLWRLKFAMMVGL